MIQRKQRRTIHHHITIIIIIITISLFNAYFTSVLFFMSPSSPSPPSSPYNHRSSAVSINSLSFVSLFALFPASLYIFWPGDFSFTSSLYLWFPNFLLYRYTPRTGLLHFTSSRSTYSITNTTTTPYGQNQHKQNHRHYQFNPHHRVLPHNIQHYKNWNDHHTSHHTRHIYTLFTLNGHIVPASSASPASASEV